jgi:sodium/potassium-transporting ATPase subunit alpha
METTNIGFYSSLVEQGTGEGVVIATGENTVLGKMSRLTRSDPGDEITCIQREVNRFVLFIVMAAMVGITSLWIFWVAWLEFVHPTFVTLNGIILNSIAMIVAFLPLGLPSAVTLGK